MGEFGNKFRKAREKKALSFDDVSRVTKIGPRMLQAIEEEHFDRLPGGVFNKGFIRAYAKHLELNDEDAVTDYLACLRQAQIDAIDAQEVRQTDRRPGQPGAAANSEKSDSEKSGREKSGSQKSGSQKLASQKLGSGKPGKTTPKPKSGTQKSAAQSPPPSLEELPELQLPRAEDVRPRRKDFTENSGLEISWRMLAIAAVVIVLAVALWSRRSHRINAAVTSQAVKPQSAPLPASTPEPNPPSPARPTSNRTPSAHSPVSIPQPLLHAASASATHSPALAPASASPTAPAADKASDENVTTNNGVAVPTSPSNPAPSDKSTAPLTLVIRATETSWISVLADGQPVRHETLIAPANTSVRATREIVAKVGNAAGVTFLWNGQEFLANGAEAEVKTFVFDSTGMRVSSATPLPAP